LTSSRPVAGLGDLAEAYDVLLCDIWGVIHDGVAADPAACAALRQWAAERGPVVLISNSPRPSAEVVEQMDSLGVPQDAWSAIVTSGDVTRDLLGRRTPGPAFRIGPERDDPLYAGLGLEFGALEDARFIACSGPNDDEVETPEDYRAVLTRAASLGLEMICANPDFVVQRGDRLIYCGGALAQLYESLGGVTIMAGKPHAPIYAKALDMARDLQGGSLDPGRILVIGDGLATDVAGANREGLDILFIANGVHGGAALFDHGKLDAQALADLLAREGRKVQFALPALAW
jgi:HAD superfamily hydrolase (TIGR01459 family)